MGSLDLSRRALAEIGATQPTGCAGVLSMSMSQNPVLWKRLQITVEVAVGAVVGVVVLAASATDRNRGSRTRVAFTAPFMFKMAGVAVRRRCAGEGVYTYMIL